MKTPKEILEDCGIVLKYESYGVAKNRHIRFLSERGLLQIGDKDFDRWANSVDIEFDMMTAKGQRSFLRWFNS